jgi:adenylate cyclase
VADAVDLEAEGLLDGLEGEARAEREELVRWLLDEGFGVERIRSSFTPMLLPAERVISGDPRHEPQAVADEAGVPLALLAELRRAQGLPDMDLAAGELLYDSDRDAAHLSHAFLEAGLSEEQMVATARVLGQGFTQVAELMRQTALEVVLRPGATELELAQAYAAVVERLSPLLGPLVEQTLRLHLRHAVETEAISAAERQAGALPGAREVTVCFADLVGFTRLGEQLEPDALEAVAARLAGLARDVAAPPVRFVKTIGDAAMLVSPDAAALLRAAFALLDAVEAERETLPQLRVGLAYGPAVSRAGDWFGRPVNLASRITGVARAGSVLVSDELHAACEDDPGVSWSFAGERHVRGVGRVKLWRARPAGDGG